MRSLVALSTVLLGGCALVWGFEERELQPEPGTGGSDATSSSASSTAATGGAGGMTSSTTVGGMGGTGGAATADVLLIADAQNNAVGVYDPVDGTYLMQDFVPPNDPVNDPYSLSFTYQAAQGPDGRVYVLDFATRIHAFLPNGDYDGVFVDNLDGASSIDFRDGDVFVAVNAGSESAVARFDVSGTQKEDFLPAVPSSGPIEPRHIHFRTNGSMLMSHVGTPNQVRLYDQNDSSFNEVFQADFATQVVSTEGGTVLSAEFDSFREHTILTGVELVLVKASAAGGVMPLENGHWLGTVTEGVVLIDPTLKTQVDSVRVGIGFWKIGRATLPVEAD